MRKLYLLLLLLNGTATLCAQSRLPESPVHSVSTQFATIVPETRQWLHGYYKQPFEGRRLMNDSLYEKWRTHEFRHIRTKTA